MNFGKKPMFLPKTSTLQSQQKFIRLSAKVFNFVYPTVEKSTGLNYNMVVYSRNLNANEVFAGYDALSQPAESYGNSEQVEYLWARSAYEHAEIHYDLLLSVDAKLLRLTPIDEEIYKHFKEQFPDFKLDFIDEDFLKSPQQKELWREFCEQYKTRVENYNFATLLRLKCDQDYSPDNTTLAPRIQFYAIEIARNREGLNDEIRKKIKTEIPLQSVNNDQQ